MLSKKTSEEPPDRRILPGKKPVTVKLTIVFGLLFLAGTIFMPIPEASVFAGVLAVPEKFQEMDQWCWAGSSQSILAYYNKSVSQTNIAAYGTNGYNTWNYLYGSDTESPYYRKGINMILNNWGLSSTYGNYTMSQTDVQNQILLSSPIFALQDHFFGQVFLNPRVLLTGLRLDKPQRIDPQCN